MTGLSTVRHFLYPLTVDGGFVFGDGEEIRPENLLPGALRGGTDTWGLATNFRVIEPGDWVWAYFGGQERRIHAVGEVAGPVGYRTDWGRHTVDIKWFPHLTQELQGRPIRYEDFQQRVPGAAARAAERTTAVLEQWLAGTPAIGKPTSSSTVSRVPREVLQRLGQGQFRADALRLFGERCAVTGTAGAAVLQAAHILAVSDGGTHAAANTLLLRADVHNLFDLGLLTVGKHLKISVAPSVTDAQYRALHGRKVTSPVGVAKKDFADHLERHRQRWTTGP
jgi:hypothetical protein